MDFNKEKINKLVWVLAIFLAGFLANRLVSCQHLEMLGYKAESVSP